MLSWTAYLDLCVRVKESLALQSHRPLPFVPSLVNTAEERMVGGASEGSLVEGEGSGGPSQSGVLSKRRRRRVGNEEGGESLSSEEAKSYMR